MNHVAGESGRPALEAAIALGGEFEVPHRSGAFAGRVGRTPLVLSAPHNARHMRDGAPKQAEPGTGPLVERLSRELDASAVWTFGPQAGDPNWDVDHPYVDALAAIASATESLVIDVHTMRNRGVDACLGLGVRRASVDGIWQQFTEHLLAESLTVSINWPFAAGSQTITSKLQALGIRCVQLELSTSCFSPRGDADKAERARSAVAAFARCLPLGRVSG